MRYLTYEQYQELGGKFDNAAFNRKIMHACGIIDNAVHCRIESMSTIPNEAKSLCRDLIDYLINNDSISEKNVASKSQSAGNVSESETYTVKSKAEQACDIDDIICAYLLSAKDDNGVPLLYRGCTV